MLEVDAAITEDVDGGPDTGDKENGSEVPSAQDKFEHDSGVETEEVPSFSS